MTSEKMHVDIKQLIKWLVIVGIPILICLLPASEILTSNIKLYLAITLFGILTFVFEPFDYAIGGLIMMSGYVLSGLTTFDVAFKPFSQTVPWMVFGCLLLINIVQNRTTLIDRIACFCMIKTGGSYNGIIYGLTILSIVINIIVPGVFTCMAIAVLAYGVCEAMDLGKTKAASGIMLAGIVGFVEAWAFIYCPPDMGVIVGAANNIVPLTMDYFTHLKYGIIYLPFPFIMAFLITKFCKPEKEINGKAYFAEHQEKLGPITANEKKVILVLLLFVIYLFTYQWHKIDMTWGFMLAPMLLYFPGLNIAKKQDVAGVNYPMVIFVASCISIGIVAGEVGVPQMISQQALPYLTGMSSSLFILCTYCFVVLFNMIMTPMALVASFVAPITQIAVDMGINPYPVLFAFNRGCYNLILPYEAAIVAAFFAFGNTKLDCFLKVWVTKIFLSAIWLFLVACPYWKFIGFL